MHTTARYIASSLFPVILIVAHSVNAASYTGSKQDERQTRPPGPPREAITACEGKSPGAKVQIRTPYGHMINATCKLIAVPEHGGRGQGGTPNRSEAPR